MGSWEGDRWAWKFRWKREWFKWECSFLEEFHMLLEIVIIEGREQDQWVWLEDPSNIFSIKYEFSSLHDMECGTSEVEIFKCLWQIKIPQKGDFYDKESIF